VVRRNQAGQGFSRTEAHLLDLSGVASFELSTADLQGLGSEVLHDAEALRVIVAPVDHVYGMSRALSAWDYQSRPNTHVVRDPAEAQTLLGLPADFLDTLGPPDLEVDDDPRITPSC
jgi:hypothetical protein